MTIRIHTGDCRERLAELAANSVQCVVTSPPYFGLRDYGTAGQIGLEPTLAAYIATLVDVFREVRRVLRDDGTCWLNLGDSYNAYNANRGGSNGISRNADVARPQFGRQDSVLPGTTSDGDSDLREHSGRREAGLPRAGLHQLERGLTEPCLKPKDLMMVPARVAIALQDDGWWVRSDIIWAKKNCMPESVTDRPTSSHEHIFLLTKSARYFYDAEAVREELGEWSKQALSSNWSRRVYHTPPGQAAQGFAPERQAGNGFGDRINPAGRNQRNVWHLATEPFPEAHFATFPSEIPRRCIKAGTSEKGACAACGAPWVRVVDRYSGDKEAYKRPKHTQSNKSGLSLSGNGSKEWLERGGRTETTGWQPSCNCDAAVVPCVVLDPFLGSGTTLLVADQLGRDGIGVELSPEYAKMAERRIRNDAPLFTQVAAD
jgi:DNA modification methylase